MIELHYTYTYTYYNKDALRCIFFFQFFAPSYKRRGSDLYRPTGQKMFSLAPYFTTTTI